MGICDVCSCNASVWTSFVGVMTDMFSEFTTQVQLSKDKPFTAMASNLVASFTLVYNNTVLSVGYLDHKVLTDSSSSNAAVSLWPRT